MNDQPSPRAFQSDYQKVMVWGCAISCLTFCGLAFASYFGTETFGRFFVRFFLFIAPLRGDLNFRRPMEGSGEWAAFWVVLALVSLDALVYFRLKNRDTWFTRFFYPDKALRDARSFAFLIFCHFAAIMLPLSLTAIAVSHLFRPNNTLQRTGHTAARR